MSNQKSSPDDNAGTADQSITDQGNEENKEKRKPSGWEIASIISGFISVIASIWIGASAYSVSVEQKKISDEGVKIARQAVEKADKANEIAEQAKNISQTANDLSCESNKIAERSNNIAKESQKASEEANNLSKDANQIAKQVKESSDYANQLAGIANQIAEQGNAVNAQSVKVNEKLTEMTQFFNNMQLNAQTANLVKIGNELFDSDKTACCRNIISIFEGNFYMMADLPREKIYDIMGRCFSDFENKDNIRLINIKDKDEECVLKNFLTQVHKEFNPLRYGIKNTKEAVEHYLYTINSYANMIAFHGMDSNINQYNIFPEISDMEYFMDLHLHKRIMIMLHDILPKTDTRGWDKVFKFLLKDEKEYKLNLLKDRDLNKKIYYDYLKNIKPGWFTDVPDYDFWKAIIAFSEKNDRRFQPQKKKE